MAMACVGQGETQAPQPVQRDKSSVGLATLPRLGLNWIAFASHISPQTRHSTLLKARQAGPMLALQSQAAWPGRRNKAPGSQALAQAPQVVQPAWMKRTSGNPPSPRTSMPSGQAVRQASQRVQRSTKVLSVAAQGGLGAGVLRWALGRPRRNSRRCGSIGVQFKAYCAVSRPEHTSPQQRTSRSAWQKWRRRPASGQAQSLAPHRRTGAKKPI